MEKVAPLFIKKGLDFKVEYLQSVRNWEGVIPKIANLHGAYRRRTIRDQDVVPHSFTFLRRESALAGRLRLGPVWPRYAFKVAGRKRAAASILVCPVL